METYISYSSVCWLLGRSLLTCLRDFVCLWVFLAVASVCLSTLLLTSCLRVRLEALDQFISSFSCVFFFSFLLNIILHCMYYANDIFVLDNKGVK